MRRCSQKVKMTDVRGSERERRTYLSSSGGGRGGPRPSSDLSEDGCPGDRGNEALLSDVDLNGVGSQPKVRSYHLPRALLPAWTQ